MNRDGFSMVEIIIGMLIFAVGVMALSASMGFMSLQLQAANLRTERDAAYQQATERLYVVDFDELSSRASQNALTFGNYSVWWDVEFLGWALAEVHVYSGGPAFRSSKRVNSVVDTLTIRIARPF